HASSAREALARALLSGRALDLGLGLENLAALVLPRLEIDVVRPAALARLLVLDVGWCAQGIRRAALAAFHARYFFPGNGHVNLSAPCGSRLASAPTLERALALIAAFCTAGQDRSERGKKVSKRAQARKADRGAAP